MISTPIPADLPWIDMSPETVDRRLRDVAQLYRLGMALREVQWLGPVVPLSPSLEEQAGPAPEDSSRSHGVMEQNEG